MKSTRSNDIKSKGYNISEGTKKMKIESEDKDEGANNMK
jgi:hypothetical protein